MTRKRTRAVYQLKVSLLEIEPPIWRRIQVWEDTKLPQLHKILQLLFNWVDYHLHEFVRGNVVCAEPDPDDEPLGRRMLDERRITLNQLVHRPGDELEYVYDFGDDWHHLLLLEAILLPEPDVNYPRCIAGARNGPPEDVGGPYGYADFLEAIHDRKHKRHKEMLEWGGPFDPEAFSLESINAALDAAFTRTHAGAKRRKPGGRQTSA